MSGLFAALKLVENGYENVTVLEVDLNISPAKHRSRNRVEKVLSKSECIVLAYLSPYRLHFVPLLFVLSFTLLITLSQADDQFGGRVRSIPFQDGIIGKIIPVYLMILISLIQRWEPSGSMVRPEI